MAKKPKNANVNMEVLSRVVAKTKEGGFEFVTVEEGKPLVDAGLIQVNTQITEGNKAAAKATAEGVSMVDGVTTAPAAPTTSSFAIITDAIPPKSKRGGGRGGAPNKYPFDALEIGQSFLVANSQVKNGDAVKSMQSSVASANARFAQETGETKSVSRTKRGEGNKAALDAAGNKIKETVTVAVKKQLRKFTVRPVVAGQVYGGWTATDSGALITRVSIE